MSNQNIPHPPHQPPQAPPGGPQMHGLQEEEEVSLGNYLGVLTTYWWIILPMAMLGGLAGLGYVKMTAPQYRAVCRYEVYENRWLKIRELENVAGADQRTQGPDIRRHIMLLRSSNLNRQVQEQLEEIWEDNLANADANPSLKITRVEEAADSMLDLEVDSFDPEYSRQYLQLLLAEYRKLRREESQQVWQDTLVNLQAERQKLTAEWEVARKEVALFEAKHNLIFATKKEASDVNYLAELIDKARAVRTQRTILDSQFPFLAEADAVTLRDVLDLTVFSTQGSTALAEGEARIASSPGWSEVPEWHQGEARVIALEEEYKAMRELYKPEHPKMQQLQKDIGAANRGLKTASMLTLKRLSSRRDALRMQEDALEEAARSIRTSMDMSVQEKAHYENLRASADHLKSMLDRVYARILDSTSGAQDSTFSRIVQGPTALARPVSPKPLQAIGMGLALGGFGGIAFVYLLHFRRQRLFSIERMERILEIGALAWIPRIPRASRSKEAFYVATLPKYDVICESYRSLRTVFEEKLGDGQVIMLTSADRGEGKTFTSANMAAVFSWRHDRVLLIDADFRKISLSQQILKKGDDAGGLIDCLEDETQDWRPFVRRKISGTLDFLPAGHSSNRASELLQGQRIEQLLNEMRNEYDIIIIDSSPVNLVVDATIFSRYVDAVAVVMVPGKTRIPALRYATNRLQAANVIGYIANNVTASSRMYYSYYGDAVNYSTYGYYGQPPIKPSSYAANEVQPANNNGKLKRRAQKVE